MKFQIHDVGHGFCAHLQHENGNVMLWDCGHKSEPENRPSTFLPQLGIRYVHRFFVTNFDEDHISDLPNLLQAVGVQALHLNTSINVAQLRALKLEGGFLSPAMESMLAMMGRYNDFSAATAAAVPPFPDSLFSVYHCNYGDFTDTNNLSLVIFLQLRRICVVIPGDIETAAWEKLLINPMFRAELQRVNIFIASHHGRENGYCKEVFDHCNPELVVFSDSEKQYSTQEMTDTYARHAAGMQVNGKTRKVVTTRSDGSIWWDNA